MATLNNPFVVYGYKGAEYFCDRQKETEKMISTLHNERNITLVAPRRMGKTGLIHHVFHQMEEQYEGAKCFYLDIFATLFFSLREDFFSLREIKSSLRRYFHCI